MARKKRTIYNNDGTVLEETMGVSENVSVIKNNSSKSYYDGTPGKELDILDIFDAFAGYLTPRLEIDDNEFNSKGECEETKCLICGASTNRAIRKICFDCMFSCRNCLYTKMKNALDTGNKKIIL